MKNKIVLTFLCVFLYGLMLLAFPGSNLALSSEYFDEEDQESLLHLSEAISAWYETNQIGQLEDRQDIERVIELLKLTHTECSQVSDKTLKKIDAEFVVQFRNNLQEGARLFESGMRLYCSALDKGKKPSEKSKSDMNNGQQKMLRFHEFYNANIERIVEDLKKKGAEIF